MQVDAMRRRKPHRKGPRRPKYKKAPFLRSKVICEDGGVVAMRFPVQCSGTRHYVAVDTAGHMTMLDHPSREMVEGFVAFGAKPPKCLGVVVDYDLNPAHWLFSHVAHHTALSREAHDELLIKMAEHVLPYFDHCSPSSQEALREARRVLREARQHAAGTFGPGYERILREDADALRGHGAERMDTCVNAAAGVVWAVVNSLLNPRSQGRNIFHVSQRIDTLIRNRVPAFDLSSWRGGILAERYWQVGQFVHALDGEKLCPSK
jgi:hypothetical protein